MRVRGRPVLGAIAGFFFGLFLSITLLTNGVLATDNILLLVFPILFLILGILWGYWAPLGSKTPPPAATGRAGMAGGAPISGESFDQGGGSSSTV